MKYAEALAQDRRLAILKLLLDSEGRGNESVLKDGLRMLGHSIGLTRDAVREDIDFLKNAGCVRLDWFDDKIVVATITERGEDCARGVITIDGIKKPRVGV